MKKEDFTTKGHEKARKEEEKMMINHGVSRRNTEKREREKRESTKCTK